MDDTLVLAGVLPTDRPRSIWGRLRYRERMRPGAGALLAELVRRRCEVWVYTTSYRSPRYLKGWFASHGVPLAGAVNQDRHDRVVGRGGPSKCPPAFGIDLHVDDSPGVALEGERHGFEVVVVAPDDPDWAARVLEAVDRRMRRS